MSASADHTRVIKVAPSNSDFSKNASDMSTTQGPRFIDHSKTKAKNHEGTSRWEIGTFFVHCRVTYGKALMATQSSASLYDSDETVVETSETLLQSQVSLFHP